MGWVCGWVGGFVCVWVGKAQVESTSCQRGVAGRRPAMPSHKHGLCPLLGVSAALLNIAGRRPAMFSRKARWGSKGGCLGFRSLGFRSLGFRSLGFRVQGLGSLGFGVF